MTARMRRHGHLASVPLAHVNPRRQFQNRSASTVAKVVNDAA
jgi:hypothetical protein